MEIAVNRRPEQERETATRRQRLGRDGHLSLDSVDPVVEGR